MTSYAFWLMTTLWTLALLMAGLSLVALLAGVEFLRENRLCRDCLHYRQNQDGRYHRCARFLNPIDGSADLGCLEARSMTGVCGPGGDQFAAVRAIAAVTPYPKGAA